MRRKLNDIYRDAAQEFADRVISVLGDQVDSIVLYGSVARGEAKRESDIDLLVVSPSPNTTRKKVSQIRSDFTYERNYTIFISLIHYCREDLDELGRIGSPFIADVIDQGVILYDNGTFSRIRQETATANR